MAFMHQTKTKEDGSSKADLFSVSVYIACVVVLHYIYFIYFIYSIFVNSNL